jgi:hypothetical protein
VLREAEIADADEAAKKWLKLARSLDYTARLLMQFALRSAAQNAASRAEPWVELAADAGAGGHAERTVVRFILDNEDDGKMSPSESALKDRLTRLESFVDLAQTVAAEFRTQLDVDRAPET